MDVGASGVAFRGSERRPGSERASRAGMWDTREGDAKAPRRFFNYFFFLKDLIFFFCGFSAMPRKSQDTRLQGQTQNVPRGESVQGPC